MNVLHFPEVPAKTKFDLAVFICPNGAGHHKRVFGALDLVLKARPETHTLVFADQTVTERFMKDFEPLQRIIASPNVAFMFGVVSPGMDIMAKDETVYTDRRWFTWLDRASHYVEALRGAQVWLDALPLGLEFWPDAICSSSFTFGPVVLQKFGGGNDELALVAKEYANKEERLMKECLPTYICPKIFVMDFMHERARVKEVGIMADFKGLPKVKTARPMIGIGGGLTGLAGEILGQVVEILLKDGRFGVAVDDKIGIKFPKLPVMGNDAADYSVLATCVVRPGVGASTNCITSATPVIAISEPDMEMENNGKRFQQYHLGIQIHKADEVLGALETILSDEWQRNYALAHSQTSLDGLQELADEILKRL